VAEVFDEVLSSVFGCHNDLHSIHGRIDFRDVRVYLNIGVGLLVR